MANPTLRAEGRKVLGRKVKKLRREGILPANVYGAKLKSQAVQVPLADFKKIFGEVGETGLVDLKVNGDTRPVLVHNIQIDPVTDEPVHADFLQVDLKEKVSAQVPIEFVGSSVAEKQGVGIVVHQMSELEVEALPTDLPDHITVDISPLAEVDQAIKVADLNVDRKKVEVKEDPERIVVNVAPPAKEEVVEAPPAEEAVPAKAAEVPEGEAPAAPTEGEEAPAAEQPQGGQRQQQPQETREKQPKG